MGEQGEQSSGEIRLPKMIIPLGVDAGEIEVYLETLKNSSMVKGLGKGEESFANTASPESAQGQQPLAASSGASTTDSLLAGIKMSIEEQNRMVEDIGHLVAAMVTKLG